MNDSKVLTESELREKVDNIDLIVNFNVDMISVEMRMGEATKLQETSLFNHHIGEIQRTLQNVSNYVKRMTAKDLKCCSEYRVWECETDSRETVFMLQRK